MSENQKPNMLILGLIIVLASVSVIIYVSQQLQVIDLTGQPEQIVTFVNAIKLVFASSAIAIAIGFSQNITLYIAKWLRVKRTEEPADVNYSLKWMTQTILKFEAVLLAATPFVEIFAQNMPPPQRQILIAGIGGFFAIVQLLIAELKRVIQETKVDATGPGPPKETAA